MVCRGWCGLCRYSQLCRRPPCAGGQPALLPAEHPALHPPTCVTRPACSAVSPCRSRRASVTTRQPSRRSSASTQCRPVMPVAPAAGGGWRQRMGGSGAVVAAGGSGGDAGDSSRALDLCPRLLQQRLGYLQVAWQQAGQREPTRDKRHALVAPAGLGRHDPRRSAGTVARCCAGLGRLGRVESA